jgi:hypothetical protein
MDRRIGRLTCLLVLSAGCGWLLLRWEKAYSYHIMVGAGLDRSWWPGMMAKSDGDRPCRSVAVHSTAAKQTDFLDGIMKFSTKDKVYIARAR